MAPSLSRTHITTVTVFLLAAIIFAEAVNQKTNTKNVTKAAEPKKQNATRRYFETDESNSQHDKRSPIDGLLGLAAPLLSLGGGGDGILKSLLGLGLSTLSGGMSDYGGSSYAPSSDTDYSQQIHRHGNPAYSHEAHPSQVTQVSLNPLEFLQTLATKGAMLGSALNAIKGVILGGSKLLGGAIDQGNSGYEGPIAVMGHPGYPAYRMPPGVLLKGDRGHSHKAALGNTGYESVHGPVGYSPMSAHYIDGPLQVPSSNQFRHPFSGFDEGNDGVLKRPPTYDDHQERYPYGGLPPIRKIKGRRPSKAHTGNSGASYHPKNPYTSENIAEYKVKTVKAASQKGKQQAVTTSYPLEVSQIGKTIQPLKNLNQAYSKSQSFKIPVKEQFDKDVTKDGHYEPNAKYGAYSYGGLLNLNNKGTSMDDSTSNYAHRPNVDMHSKEYYDGSAENRYAGNDFSLGLPHQYNNPSMFDGNFENEYQGTSYTPNYYHPMENSPYDDHTLY